MTQRSLGSHQSRKMASDSWLTPPEIIQALGSFDLDPCTPDTMPWTTATSRYTKKDNGLLQAWFGRVWLNPPFGDQASDWMRRMVRHGNGIALLHARTETERLFFSYVWPFCDSILFIRGRLFFYTPEGVRSRANAGAPSCLISYGKNNIEPLLYSGIPGKHLYVNTTPMIIIGVSPSWISVVRIAVRDLGDKEMQPIYSFIERFAPDKVRKNPNWKPKVRQKIQLLRKEAYLF